MEKPREFWVYEGLKNLSTLIFIYRKAQPIKQTAPENFNEICVIEKSAYDQLLADARELQKALETAQNYLIWREDDLIGDDCKGDGKLTTSFKNRLFEISFAFQTFTKKYGSAE